MKKLIISSIFFLLISTGVQAQVTIKKTVAYAKSLSDNSHRLLVLLSDNSIWWYSGTTPWKPVSLAGLPEGFKVQDIIAYLKPSMYSSETRYVVVLDDNSVWYYVEDKPWQKVELKPVPDQRKIQTISVIPLMGGMASDVKFIIQCTDNTIYSCTSKSEWTVIDLSTLKLN